MAQSRRPPGAVAPRRYQRIREAGQIALFDSPVRQDIVDTLEALGGEADVATVAAQLGRPPDGLYYHFQLLLEGGLLQALEGEGGGRRYRIGTRRGTALKLDYRGDADSEAAVGRVVDRLLGTARRDFHAALAQPDTVVEGTRRELWAGRNKGWVDAKALAEINLLLARIQSLLQGPRRAGRDRLVSVSFVLAPLPAKPGRRASKRS
jgi:DNA-binding transcriptional ArsR family regulator